MTNIIGSKPTSPLQQRTIDCMILSGLADSTQKTYMWELRQLSRYYGHPPEQLDAEQIRDYVLQRIHSGCAPASTNVTVAALRLFYIKVLDEPERIAQLSRRPVKDRLPRPISEADVMRLFKATFDVRYRTAFELAYSTGLRISEVLELQPDDLSREQQMVRVRRGKGGHERRVFVPPALFEKLDRYWRQIYPKPQCWLFYGKSPEQPLKAHTLRRAFNQARDRVGLGRDITFHSLRHSLATHLLERGAPPHVVQDVLGHKSADSTRVYARSTAAMFQRLDHPAAILNR